LNRFLYYFLLFLFVGKIYSEESRPRIIFYGTTEYFESRYVKDNQRTKTNFYVGSVYKNWQGAVEKRGETPLASMEFKNKYFYFSAGNRYKPISGFYILRNEKYYSAFQNPRLGLIEQPLKRSYWMGVNPFNWSAGFFIGEDMAVKRPAFYFKSPENLLAYTYSPETKIHFIAANIRDYRPKSLNKMEFNLSSQLLGKRENYFGYFNFRVFEKEKGLETELSLYKEDNGGLFVSNQDNLKETSSEKAVFLKISKYHYNRVEIFQTETKALRERRIGINSSLFSGKYGAICVSGRGYEDVKSLSDKREISTTIGVGISYEYRFKSTEFMFRLEQRKNQDELAELKWTIRPIVDWKLEISSLLQKDSNQFRSLYEQWSDGENINTILTNRSAAFKLKLVSSFLVFNVSGSRRPNGTGEVYFANIQMKQEF